MAENISLNERADALERKMSDELDVLLSKSALFNMADGKLGASNAGADLAARHGKYYLMADDPRLPRCRRSRRSPIFLIIAPRASTICCKARPMR